MSAVCSVFFCPLTFFVGSLDAKTCYVQYVWTNLTDTYNSLTVVIYYLIFNGCHLLRTLPYTRMMSRRCTLNFTKGFIIKSRSISTPSQFSSKSFQLSPDSTWLLSRLFFLFQELLALSQLFMVNFAQLYFIPRISKTLSGLFRHVSFIYYSPWGLFSPLVSHDHSCGVTACQQSSYYWKIQITEKSVTLT